MAITTGTASVAIAAPRLPADIRAFTEKRDGCDHFRGEPWDSGDEPEVTQRREFIFENIRLLCSGTDRRLASLQKKYRRNKAVLERLGQYDQEIELKPGGPL